MKTALTLYLARQPWVGVADAIPSRHLMGSISTGVSFDQLPLNEGDPPYSAWGLWGKGDELGRINLITPQVRKNAAAEIKTGEAISLK